jgi:hypothetical protein
VVSNTARLHMVLTTTRSMETQQRHWLSMMACIRFEGKLQAMGSTSRWVVAGFEATPAVHWASIFIAIIF